MQSESCQQILSPTNIQFPVVHLPIWPLPVNPGVTGIQTRRGRVQETPITLDSLRVNSCLEICVMHGADTRASQLTGEPSITLRLTPCPHHDCRIGKRYTDGNFVKLACRPPWPAPFNRSSRNLPLPENLSKNRLFLCNFFELFHE